MGSGATAPFSAKNFLHPVPITLRVTEKESLIILWDAGTEVNQEPGIGPDQGPRQKAPNTGKAENGVVRNAKDVKYGKAYTNVSSVMRITIRPLTAASEAQVSHR